jgi:hypothetical protein
MTVYALLSFFLISACKTDDPEPGVCGEGGESFEVAAADYCFYRIIEDGFLCPEDYPFEHEYRGTVICSQSEELGAEVFDWVDEALDGPSGGGPDAGADASGDLGFPLPDGGEDRGGEDRGGDDRGREDRGGDDRGREDRGGDGGVVSFGEAYVSNDGLACWLPLYTAWPSMNCSAADIGTDDYTIESAQIYEALLVLTVSYSGGCVDHNFSLCYELFEDGDPITNMISLIHIDNDDPCDGIVTEEIEIDLRALADAFIERFGGDTVDVTLELGLTPIAEEVVQLAFLLGPDTVDPDCCESLGDDDFFLSDVSIEADELVLDISYSGGCEDHDFTFCTDASHNFLESFPVQYDIVVTHDAHGDACEAELAHDLRLDLTGIRNLMEEVYPGSESVILRINTPGNEMVPILYEY